ncbi:hypothetical protein V6N13_038180 [Hibiscus sabdariffa]
MQALHIYLVSVPKTSKQLFFFPRSIHTQPVENVQGPRRQSESPRASSPRWFITSQAVSLSPLFPIFSTVLNCQASSPLGSFVLNVRIVGKLYDKEALKQSAAKGLTRSMVKELAALSKNCYRLCFVILAATTDQTLTRFIGL